MSEFSFASLIKPGEGAMRALRQYLKVRQARDAARKPSHWVYGGAADLLLKHGTFFTGLELPDKWEQLRGPMQNCHENSLRAAEADASLRYFTGLYMIAGEPDPHSWCVDGAGKLVELTLPGAGERGTHPMTAKLEGGPEAPMLTPAHWAYVGVEYDAAFVRAHLTERGLPILDPTHTEGPDGGLELGCYLDSEELPMWTTRYDPGGFVIPSAPDLCTECLGWGCDDCNQTGIRP